MTATELLRETRKVCHEIQRGDLNVRNVNTLAEAIDALLSQPEPTMSAEEVREACAL